MIQCFILYNLSTLFNFPCEYVYLTFIIMGFAIKTKHHTILFNKVEINNPFTFEAIQFILVHSTKNTDDLLFITGYLLFSV